ncbi:MAG: hypothetical protein AAF292_04400 [Pseudomonadota bacterium]
MSDPILVQYKVLSEQRLHFGRLYWQSVAFLFALLIGFFAVSNNSAIIPLPIGLALAGAVTILMGFVADRLRRLEGQYEDCLEAIENSLKQQGHHNIQIAPKSGKRGARFVITLGLYALGAMITLLAAWTQVS